MLKNKILVDYPDSNPILAKYYRNFMIFANFGLLRHWVLSDMRHSPEVMGESLFEFVGLANIKRITEKFKDKIKQKRKTSVSNIETHLLYSDFLLQICKVRKSTPVIFAVLLNTLKKNKIPL